MTQAPLADETRASLQSVSVATLATALFTLCYIPAREDLNPLSVFEDPKHPQRAAIGACPRCAVMVVDNRQDPRATSAGSILITRSTVHGGFGVVTDGGFRDSAEIAQLDFPAYHQRASAPTNLTLYQAVDINVPIGCGGAPRTFASDAGGNQQITAGHRRTPDAARGLTALLPIRV